MQDPWVRKIPWRRKWQPTPIILPGKSHGQRSLVGYNPWGSQKSQTQLIDSTAILWCLCWWGNGSLPIVPLASLCYTYISFLLLLLQISTNLAAWTIRKCVLSQFWRAEIQKGLVGRAPFLLEVTGENRFPCMSQPLEATCMPWLMASSFRVKASRPCRVFRSPSDADLCHYISFCNSDFVTSPLQGPLWLHWAH